METTLSSPLAFKSGHKMKNRFMLAPLTNKQSHEDGRLSEDEFQWLTKRAKGGFGLVMTCASYVQAIGKGFSGQLGIFSDDHITGHQRLSAAIKSHGSLAVLQLHHAGMRSPEELIGETPVCPSANDEHGARALMLSEVYALRDDFITAAKRAKAAGYDGVEVHGAHGYILTQFLSPSLNKRTDEYGGTLENRARLLFEIIEGIREACGTDFLLGLRLSPERFGVKLAEILDVYKRLIKEEQVDFIDMSLWDVFKKPEDPDFQDKTLLKYFTDIDRKDIKLTVAGKIRTAADVQRVIDDNVDFVTVGVSGILHHDFPKKVLNNKEFKPIALPVSSSYLSEEGLGPKFIDYMKKWPGFVEDEG